MLLPRVVSPRSGRGRPLFRAFPPAGALALALSSLAAPSLPSATAQAVGPAPPPTYAVRRHSRLPAFERLAPADFATAEPLTLSDALTAGPPSEETVARFLWDEKALYACFEMEAADPATRSGQHDADLWEGSVVELFLDPLRLGKAYYEIEINPLGATFEALILNDAQAERRGRRFQIFRDWNPASLRSRSDFRKARGRWVVLLAVDFADLFLAAEVPPKVGDVWRANVLRINGLAPRQQNHAWSPPRVPDFHNVRAFGSWRFVAAAFRD